MAAKGSQAKQDITNKLLETFEGSFLYNDGKEIRIPAMEDGMEVQIKVTLTCAKTNVNAGDDTAIPGSKAASTAAGKINFEDISVETVAEALKPTQEEKENIASLLKTLGL